MVGKASTGTFNVSSVVRTLVANGYVISKFERPTSGAFLATVSKRDILGAKIQMLLLFTRELGFALEKNLCKSAEKVNGTAVVVDLGKKIEPKRLDVIYHQFPNFLELLGGEVRTDRIFQPNLNETMSSLGRNFLPKGIKGTPDDLLEEYSKDCLQFLLECPVRRYGQERRFESLPDGIALGKDKVNFYFDAKAYGDRYHPTADDVKRFSSYILDFNSRYSQFLGKIWRFLVISGSFSDDDEAIAEKCLDLEVLCDTKFVLIRASDLATAIGKIKKFSGSRSAINWRRVFNSARFSLDKLDEEISRIERDGMIK